MAAFPDNIFTKNLTNDTLTFTGDMGIQSIAMNLVSGTASFTGSMKLGGAIDSEPIPLVVGEPVTISDNNNIDGFTIDASSGIVKVIARK